MTDVFDAAEALWAAAVATAAYPTEAAARERLRQTADESMYRTVCCEFGSDVSVLAVRRGDMLTIGFSGLDSLYDWLLTARARARAGFFDARLATHTGFDAMAASVWPTVFDWVAPRLRSRDTGVLFTGHSAGGAVAQHVANGLRRSFWQRDLRAVTFGAPRLYAADTATLAHGATHFVVDGDLVSQVPPQLFPFRYSTVGAVHRLGDRPGLLLPPESRAAGSLLWPARLFDLLYGDPPRHFMASYVSRLSHFS